MSRDGMSQNRTWASLPAFPTWKSEVRPAVLRSVQDKPSGTAAACGRERQGSHGSSGSYSSVSINQG